MQPYRTILFTILVVGLSTIVPTSAGICDALSHDAVFGKKTQFDRLLFRDRITQAWTFLGYAERYLAFPVKGKQNKKITVIEIFDQYDDGNGGCFSITKGGVGFTFLEIRFVSNFMRGFDFIVKIYSDE